MSQKETTTDAELLSIAVDLLRDAIFYVEVYDTRRFNAEQDNLLKKIEAAIAVAEKRGRMAAGGESWE